MWYMVLTAAEYCNNFGYWMGIREVMYVLLRPSKYYALNIHMLPSVR